MGLLDYYRQFSGMSQEEVSEELRGVAAERRAKALERVETLDLSTLAWPGFPHPSVVNEITYAARARLHRPPDPRATDLRRALAEGHGIDPEQIAVGAGVAQLMAAAARVLLTHGEELLTPWPSYPLYPVIARHAGAHPRSVEVHGADALLEAVSDETRVITLCNPNDPTGEHLPAGELRRLLERLPERVTVLLDEALADYVDAEEADASLRLLDDFPRMLVFRSFSKAWALAGLRCGYVIGAAEAAPVLEALPPALGVDTLAQVGALEALRISGRQVAERRATVIEERERLTGRLRGMGIEVPDSQANLVWLRVPRLDADELHHRLQRAGIIVQSGTAYGVEDRVRVAVQQPIATDRFLTALEKVL